MRPIDVGPRDLAKVTAILRAHIPEFEVRAFGSRVRWTARENSDLDLAIMTERPLSALRIAELRDAFSESGLPFKVDIIDWASVKEPFREIVRREYETLQIPVRGDVAKEYVRLDQVADILSGGTPSKSNLDYWEGDIPWVSAKDLKTDRLREAEDHISQDGLDAGSKLAPSASTLVLVRGMTLLSDVPVCYAERDLAFNQDIKALVPHPEIVSEYFYYAVVAAKPFLREMVELAGHGTGRLPTDRISGFEIRLPPRSEQQAIVNILSTLDGKIDLNRRTNETLESIARAIFKSWFVDFDPVKDKAAGRNAFVPRSVAQLFPSRLIPSELGEIPEGWELSKLGAFITRRVDRREPSVEVARMPYVPIECISSNSLFLQQSRPGTDAQSSLIGFKTNDILFGAMRPYFHKVCIAPFDGTTRTTTFVFYPKRIEDYSYTTMFLHEPSTVDFATRHSKGSTIPYAVWDGSMADMPIICPPKNLREAYDELVRPFLSRIPSVYFQNGELIALRDALLPKLISGEIRVKDAERLVAEHV